MPSYQDIEMRLKVVEDKLDFVMKNFHAKGFQGNGLVNPDGSPQGKVIETDLLGLYHLSRQALKVVEAPDELIKHVEKEIENAAL